MVKLLPGMRVLIVASLILSASALTRAQSSVAAPPVSSVAQSFPPADVVRGLTFASVITASVPGTVNDMVYDSGRGRLYVAHMAGGGSSTSGIASIDLVTGAVQQPFTVVGQPLRLALTSDQSWLYVAGDIPPSQGAQVQRINLTTQQVDLTFSGVFTRPNETTLPALVDIAAIPGQPASLLIEQRDTSFFRGTLAVYDDGQRRPLTATAEGTIYDLTFSSADTLLGTSPYLGIMRAQIATTGVTLTPPVSVGNTLWDGAQFSGARVYSSYLDVYDVNTGAPLWRYGPPTSQSERIAVDRDYGWLFGMQNLSSPLSVYDLGSSRRIGQLTTPVSGVVTIIAHMISAGPGRIAIATMDSVVHVVTVKPLVATAFLPTISRPDPATVVRDFPQNNRCSTFPIQQGGVDMARVEMCVTNVQFRHDGNMAFAVRWTATFLRSNTPDVLKHSDLGNTNMYARDGLGRRYDHIALAGAAGQDTYMTRAAPSITGSYVFPMAQTGAVAFEFHDADQGAVIQDIRIQP